MKIMVVIPTYNESRNISKLIEDIFSNLPGCQIVVVDDNSPDGCGDLVEKLSLKYASLHLIKRVWRKGRGSAGLCGFKYALSKGMDFIIEMDADFSHQPKYLSRFQELGKNHDIVIGSRLVKGGRDLDRGLIRTFITKAAGLYIKYLLGIKVKDVTSGFRGFKAKVLRAIDLDSIISNGPVILQEILFRAQLLGFRIKEFPITFVDRLKGKSTFNWRVMVESLSLIPVFRFIYLPIWKTNLSRKKPDLPRARSGQVTFLP
ncbi:polyprenol monophosphomannose synthase [Candidatus Riflebacteria bacterium]